ncbi:MAG: protein kinase [Myxococcota bacterium]
MSATAEMTPGGGVARPKELSRVGHVLDHYTLQEELGQGGMSVVYRARDEVLQRDVAIKVLHPFLADRQDAKRRLAREARAVAKLRHPNILEVYGFSGEEAEQGYISMELVRGETLKQFSERERIYPCEVAAAVTWVVAGALEHAHLSGVIHRDVKPENVMIRQDGVLKLMDFGIAHVVDAAHLTITGTLQGSPAHMAPEVIEGADVDPRADLFSLGTVLFWLATGQLPFTAKTPHALLKKIVEGRYTEPQRINPEISDRLAGVIRKVMAKDPNDRYASAAELRTALQAVWEEGGLEDPTVSLPLFFKQPQKYRTEWAEVAANRFVAQAQAHLKAGDRVKALGAVNRVLALRPNHPEAPAIMKRIERGSRVAGRVRIALGIGAVLGLAAAAVGVARMVEVKSEEVAQAQDGLMSEAPTPVTPEPRPATVEQPRVKQQVRVAPRAETPVRQQTPAQPPPTTVAEVTRPQPAPEAAANRPVTFRVDPWGDVEVDGQVLARGKKVSQLMLAPGVHRVRFLHRYAQTEERMVDVPAEGGPTEVNVQLHRAKPAYLTVIAAEDPDVFVDGVYKGTAKDSERTPILVNLPDRTSQVSVKLRVRGDGKEAVVEQKITAGETLRVPVKMEDALPVEPERRVLPVEEPSETLE